MTDDRLQYLLNRYLDQQATPEECEAFEEWYAQQQGQEAGLLDQEDKAAVAAYSQPILESLHQQIEEAEQAVIRPAAHIMILRRIGAAAAILITFSLGLYFWQSGDNKLPQVATTSTADSMPPTRTIRIRNTTDATRQYSLEDGSVIDLAANSSVQYEQPFTHHTRNIYLKGKAFFKVAKDTSRPFTVFSGDISTTALGTAFTVTAFENEPQVKVQLHEGKVVIRSIAQNNHQKMQDAFLLPGQELAYHVQTATANIRYLASTNQGSDNNKAKPLSAGSRTGMEASFEQEPLEHVLQQLARGYGVRLQYNKEDVAYMDFSGKINKQDSLAKVINRIALLHRLEVVKTPAGYRIRKNQ